MKEVADAIAATNNNQNHGFFGPTNVDSSTSRDEVALSNLSRPSAESRCTVVVLAAGFQSSRKQMI